MTTDQSPYGLSADVIAKIHAVFGNFASIEKAILYGSRAKGTYRNGSDIDLTLIGKNLTHTQLLSIELALDELMLPYKFDLSLHHQLDSPELLDHIRRVGIEFYRR